MPPYYEVDEENGCDAPADDGEGAKCQKEAHEDGGTHGAAGIRMSSTRTATTHMPTISI